MFNQKTKQALAPYILTVFLFVCFIIGWHVVTALPKFDSSGLTEDELLLMEFNADIVKNENDQYVYNPEKARGIPGPNKVLATLVEELSHPFHKEGTNDHGIGHLVNYSVGRFVLGFISASLVAVILGVLIGLNKTLLVALNPFIQVLKPISPVAWMPLLLYSVQNPFWTVTLVVFMASLWPTVANTAFGVSSIRKDFLQVSRLIEFSYFRQLIFVILPAAAPAIIAGLRISFGSALVAVVPAEMLLGELGIGYLIWIYWNNLDISGVIFAILVVGAVGVILDASFAKLSQMVSYPEM